MSEPVGLLGPRRYDAAEVAARAGVPPELAARFWRALGFPDVSPEEEPAFTDGDVEALRIAAGAIERGLSSEVSLQLTRVYASSVARVAETQVGLAGTVVDLRAAAQTPRLLEHMWRRHLDAALQRASAREAAAGEAPVAVGFADMVGFTALSQELDAQELAELVDRFETLTHDQVVSLGGRVVKMIGDEVLFVVDDLAAAAEVALALARDWSGTEARSAVRAGLAWGAVLTRYGDVFGPVVNRASRIVALARPGTVLVGPEVHAELEDHPGLAWRSLRPQRLKGIGRLPLWVLRRA